MMIIASISLSLSGPENNGTLPRSPELDPDNHNQDTPY